MAAKTGVVTASALNLRAGPSTGSALVRTLARGTRVYILATAGAWYRVKVGNQRGYVHGDFVRILEIDPAAGFLNERDDLRDVPLEPSAAGKIAIKASFNGTQKLAAEAWNTQGGLLEILSGIVEVDPAAAVAVLCVESSGRGFGDDGRMIIRFENHVFWSRWGVDYPDRFNAHFRYNASKKWLGHQFCEIAGGEWSDCHKSQADEWRVFEFARRLDEPSAIRSISMGGPQIMGFNHHLVGYETPRAMLDRFQADLRWQVIGLFDFVKGSGTTSPMLQALQRRRFDDFATHYNGPGQAAEYGGRIQRFYEAFEGLRQ